MAVPRRGLLGLSVLAVVLAAGGGVLLWQAVELSSVAQVAAQVDELKLAVDRLSARVERLRKHLQP